jgi:cytidine deaminase
MTLSADEHRELIQQAVRALDNSNPSNPPNLRFGAAVLTQKGAVYSSSAFWSDTLSLALHAEHAAIAHAAAHGERDLVAVACVSTEDAQGERLCHPCGICKQLLYESFRSSRIDLEVIMASLSGRFIVKHISEITPYPWPIIEP